MKKEEIKRYIELMYNKNSDLNKIEDLKERKIQAAIKAKLDPNDPEVIKIMELKNEKVRGEIIEYLNRCNSNAFVKLIGDQQLFWGLQQILMKPLEDEVDTNKLMTISERSEELVERIENGYKKIYLEQELADEGKKVIKMISPEMRLKQKSTG